MQPTASCIYPLIDTSSSQTSDSQAPRFPTKPATHITACLTELSMCAKLYSSPQAGVMIKHAHGAYKLNWVCVVYR